MRPPPRWATALLAAALLLGAPRGEARGDDTGGGGLDPLPAENWTREDAAHLLRRAAWGGTGVAVDALFALGLDAAVDSLLQYEGIDWPDRPSPRITIREQPDRRMFDGLSEDEVQALRNEFIRADQEQFGRIQEWWLRCMATSPRPLEERMTLFWHGHFTSSFRSVRNSYWMFVQNTLFRGRATGNFGTLLKEVTRDPAMLRFLDGGRNRKGNPNENYAREVMELFTMGVGNYGEADVKEAARALTGLTVQGFLGVLRPRDHDEGEKTILGERGRFGPDELMDLLLSRPATASRLARRLLVFFAQEDPDPETVEALATVLRESGYEVKPALRALFRSQAFYSAAARGTQVKGPVDLVVGAIRTLGLDPPPAVSLSRWTRLLGQEVLDPPSVKGWDGGRAWISTSSLLQRYNLLSAVVGTEQDRRAFGARGAGTSSSFDPLELLGEGPVGGAEAADRLARAILAVPLPPATLKAAVAILDRGTPFDRASADAREKVRRALVLLVSTPEFQVQ